MSQSPSTGLRHAESDARSAWVSWTGLDWIALLSALPTQECRVVRTLAGRGWGGAGGGGGCTHQSDQDPPGGTVSLESLGELDWTGLYSYPRCQLESLV